MTNTERLVRQASIERIFHAGANALRIPDDMREQLLADLRDRWQHLSAGAAFADGPVADTAEPVAAEARRPIPKTDRDDTHTMGHA